MNTAPVDHIVRAVLYEGHILYPYRPSSIKNRKRFTFGRVYPRTYCRIEEGREAWTMTTECLLQVGPLSGDKSGPGSPIGGDESGPVSPNGGDESGPVSPNGGDESGLLLQNRGIEPKRSGETDATEIEVGVRFLQPIDRQVIDEDGREVDRLLAGGEVHQTWHDVIERSVKIGPIRVTIGRRCVKPFAFSASGGRDEIRADGKVAGYVERRHPRLAGSVELIVDSVDRDVFKVRVVVSNESTLPENLARNDNEVLLRTFASTHTVLQVSGGRFFSMMDPPETYAEAASVCENMGTWPVLVGEEGQRDTILSSPIILYDYPEIAPESAGDFFDSTEIDELLSLRVMTLTDDEKAEMHRADEFARRILHRTEHLDKDDLFGMHGTLRGLKELSHQVPPKQVEVDGYSLAVGDRVRIRPKKMTDVMDVALAGKTAEIESIEQDFEGRIHLALVIDDDPGRDLGFMRQPGHRFFYGPDDVEVLGAEGR